MPNLPTFLRWLEETAILDKMWRNVSGFFDRPAQALESPTTRPRQHETKRRATARFGVAKRLPPHAAQQALCYTLQQGGVWAKSVAGS